ncbi:hypothetical protein MTP04_02490 [Lysinibacillus sp. PLM2]|nr:hypothetical protein MTP04_02490 [Lysinibacillus sp. PLM2]
MYNRLEEVKRQHEGQKKIDFFGVTLHPRDIDWLIEEAQKVELLNAEKDVLQAKWEAQGLMIQKLHEENKRMKETIDKVKNTVANDVFAELVHWNK